MQSLNELVAHTIECVHASISIRKQNEAVRTTANIVQSTAQLRCISLGWNRSEYEYESRRKSFYSTTFDGIEWVYPGAKRRSEPLENGHIDDGLQCDRDM